jgi:hypothetical protein
MRPCLCLVILVVAGSSCARADGPWPLFDDCPWAFAKACPGWQQRRCWCPDDYCPRSLPAVALPCKGCKDDYCPKAIPVVSPTCKGCKDDYCPKSLPCPGKLCEPWYSCGPCKGPGLVPLPH